MGSGVIQSKRTITELIIQTALKISFGGGLDKYLKSDVSGNAVWADLMPSTTACVFYQKNAPLGWTAVALNDFMLRVVPTGGTGGTTGGTWIGAGKLTLTGNHTHSITDHNHNLPALTGLVETGGTLNYLQRSGPGTMNVDSGGTNAGDHAHYLDPLIAGNMTAAVSTGVQSAQSTVVHGSAQHAYADIIICTKD